MKKFQQIISLILVVVFAAISFSGCGANNESASSTSSVMHIDASTIPSAIPEEETSTVSLADITPESVNEFVYNNTIYDFMTLTLEEKQAADIPAKATYNPDNNEITDMIFMSYSCQFCCGAAVLESWNDTVQGKQKWAALVEQETDSDHNYIWTYYYDASGHGVSEKKDAAFCVIMTVESKYNLIKEIEYKKL